MNRLIKSELKKDLQLTYYWGFILGIVLMQILLCFSDDMNSINFVQSQLGEFFIILPMMMTAFIAGRGFSQRTNMYDIMMGNRPLKIIVSKLLSIGFITACIISFISLSFFFVISLVNSTGFNDAFIKEMMFILLIYKAAFAGVLLALCFRSLASIAIVYLRVMLESIILVVYGSIKGNLSDIMDSLRGTPRIFDLLFYSNQISMISEGSPSADSLINILSGFAIMLLVWGGITYLLYKHKDF